MAEKTEVRSLAATDDLPEDKISRERWRHRGLFILAACGSAIGLGNIWRFPYLTYKHGGAAFIGAYLFAMIVCGIPMLILELTLGQKFQKGSAGSYRGITPRLAGAGWAASFAGFVTCIVYNILLAISIVYMYNSNDQSWLEHKFSRPPACQSAELSLVPSAELFLYMKVTKLIDESTCLSFEEGDPAQFAGELFGMVVVVWVLCFVCVSRGSDSI